MCSSFSVVFRFSPDSLTWVVSRGKKVLSRHCRKRDAVREAARLARADGRAEVRVERMDGTIQCRHRYGLSRSSGSVRAREGEQR
ncbi:DUF2188 domain-containing protein [Saccharomonospora viridis]|jgi:hypothetical protein|uniref:DUF2188 domain-containing protein n=1 Tax=Saccharomonospora viridis (strain ATCC 15386 / DSM 43017 / JCM 3036 / CCUG 5913 / NBRC 12207 / NCIMB 9602 / P101) TaxID=471857 RepID=C7MSE5_SACVD|nr:DUF2188 domain-containing protein [Saccharomonospora viridis]ACU95258.1 hypothetical protein Svir_01710 [Saccharomonospora viridis DSM 43017]